MEINFSLHNFQKYTKLARFGEKIVDVNEICDIILCSAIKIPEQSYDAQYRTGGRLGVRLCQM